VPVSLPAGRGGRRVEWSAVTLWGARAAWIAVAVVGGSAIGEALADRSRAVQLTGTIGAWTAWGVTALALAVTGVVTLTVVRALVPGSIVVAVIAAVTGATGAAVLALAVPAVVATVLVGSAETGRRYVEAEAYGDEQRFPLRPPYGYLTASAVTWAVWVAALITAPLALAGGNPLLGGVAAVVAGIATWLFPRRWHQLSRRWLVIVPAGLVVHDPVVLAETLMLPRRLVATAAATTVRGGALDLTGPTPGVAVELTLAERVTAVLAPRPRTPRGRGIHLSALLVAPSRPGGAVRELQKTISQSSGTGGPTR
jgi:hypothetical protein